MSPRSHRLTRWARHACRRAASAVLLALQVAFVSSSVFERAGQIRLDTHAEQQGHTHLTPHDESNCVVCSVRTLSVDAPHVAPLFTTASGRRQAVAKAEVESGVEPGPGQHSRAPPVGR
ncbi:MAG: hypothetical protein ACYC5V_15995 [Gemmatimonadaceae bacterium]